MTLTERKLAEWKRKIANGKRKQAEALHREKEKMWDRLKRDPNEVIILDYEIDTFYISYAQIEKDLIKTLAKQMKEKIDAQVMESIFSQANK